MKDERDYTGLCMGHDIDEPGLICGHPLPCPRHTKEGKRRLKVVAIIDPQYQPVKALLEEMTLRRILWLNHGCEGDALYGDDEKMQCSNCLIDFIRMPAEVIGHRLSMRKKIQEKENEIDTSSKRQIQPG